MCVFVLRTNTIRTSGTIRFVDFALAEAEDSGELA
jgi:hypothetical protein